PTAGVDVELRAQLWAYVRELNRQGTTVLLTTHYLEEAEELCDRIAIINHGRLIANDRKAALMNTLDAKHLVITLRTPLAALPQDLSLPGASVNDEGQLVITYKPSIDDLQAILHRIQACGLPVRDLTTQQSDLEDVFRHFTSAA
ncbi:MAG: ABC transporter ATP-binding protein, partial [Alphaproteobacteria bacterium]|nr:ABC transporter ATP-binding protein [Alphaproteobacteria bacterium]